MNNGIYLGIIKEVYYCNDGENINKNQVEYRVDVYMQNMNPIDVHCTRLDYLAGTNNYEDVILTESARVYVQMIEPFKNNGTIIGGPRITDKLSLEPTDKSKMCFKKRFNQITESITTQSMYVVGFQETDKDDDYSTYGPHMKLNAANITMQADSSGDNAIVIDRDNKKISINTDKWEVTVNGDSTINASGNCTINVTGSCDLTAATLTAKIKGTADIDASTITLNGATGIAGNVITTLTQPTCFVTGIPFVGSLTVKAGS